MCLLQIFCHAGCTGNLMKKKSFIIYSNVVFADLLIVLCIFVLAWQTCGGVNGHSPSHSFSSSLIWSLCQSEFSLSYPTAYKTLLCLILVNNVGLDPFHQTGIFPYLKGNQQNENV